MARSRNTCQLMAVDLEIFEGIRTRRQRDLHIVDNVKKLDHFVFVTAMVLLRGPLTCGESSVSARASSSTFHRGVRWDQLWSVVGIERSSRAAMWRQSEGGLAQIPSRWRISLKQRDSPGVWTVAASCWMAMCVVGKQLGR